jgi:putative acetyltransferase
MQPRTLLFRIRAYQDGDGPIVAQLFYDSVRELGPRRYRSDQVGAWAPASPDPAALHARATDGRITLVAIDAAGEIIAWGDLEHDGHIDNLYCRPHAAGTGVPDRRSSKMFAPRPDGFRDDRDERSCRIYSWTEPY